jgi:2-C-methyl-D-erythritol 4-phosphate cytidylyltransferase
MITVNNRSTHACERRQEAARDALQPQSADHRQQEGNKLREACVRAHSVERKAKEGDFKRQKQQRRTWRQTSLRVLTVPKQLTIEEIKAASEQEVDAERDT